MGTLEQKAEENKPSNRSADTCESSKARVVHEGCTDLKKMLA
jgi:hypothetical protein